MNKESSHSFHQQDLARLLNQNCNKHLEPATCDSHVQPQTFSLLVWLPGCSNIGFQLMGSIVLPVARRAYWVSRSIPPMIFLCHGAISATTLGAMAALLLIFRGTQEWIAYGTFRATLCGRCNPFFRPTAPHQKLCGDHLLGRLKGALSSWPCGSGVFDFL